jgi:hypothetical protein
MDDFEDLVATGLPPHTMLLAQVQELKEVYRQTADGMLCEIRSEMDNRTMGGVLSEARITELLRTELNVIRGEFNLLGGTQEDQHQRQQEVDATTRNALRRKVYFTAGKFRRVPEGWLFPKGTCAVMWSSWMCHDVTNEISAMRYFDPIDVKHLKRGAKTFSELKQLMRTFEAVAIEKELWKEDCTPLDANSIYGSIFGIVTQEIQQDRIGELSWHTIFRELKKIDRKKKAAAAEEEGNEGGEEDSNSNE